MSGGRVPVVASEHHTVFYSVPARDAASPPEEPPAPVGAAGDRWDEQHVRLPCSPSNLYPVKQPDGQMQLVERWAMVQEALLSEMHTSEDLEKAIKSYNSRYQDKWDFSGLKYFIDEILCDEERDHLFAVTLPRMARLALQLPELLLQPLPLLRAGRSHSLSLTQLQVACLLANAFFCTFPRRNAASRKAEKPTEYSTYPDINFNRLFGRGRMTGRKQPGIPKQRAEKYKCLMHYFHRVLERPPVGALTFTRRHVDEQDLPHWAEMGAKFRELTCQSEGFIEDQQGMLQVDFANKNVGGGVLGDGCVQEEIRFVINPELIVSRLFTEVLGKTECLVVTGSERFSEGTGYADTFRWTAKAKDPTPFDEYGRRLTQVVALDARSFRQEKRQYEPGFLLRELNKAYVGFWFPSSSTGATDDDSGGNATVAPPLPTVATGNWGCGAFNGNPRLKSLLQLMAAAVAGRDLMYLTFGDEQLRDDIRAAHQLLRQQNVSVAQLYSALAAYGRLHGPRSPRPCILTFLHSQFAEGDYGTDTDVDREDWSQEMEIPSAGDSEDPVPLVAKETPAEDSESPAPPLSKDASSELVMDVEAGPSTAATSNVAEQERLLMEASFGDTYDGKDLEMVLAEKRSSRTAVGAKRVRRAGDELGTEKMTVDSGGEGSSCDGNDAAIETKGGEVSGEASVVGSAASNCARSNVGECSKDSRNGRGRGISGETRNAAEMFAKFEVVSETSRHRTPAATKQTSITSFLKKK